MGETITAVALFDQHPVAARSSGRQSKGTGARIQTFTSTLLHENSPAF